MRTTIDVPDDLYRQVKARAALEGRSVRDVTLQLYAAWLAGGQAQDDSPPDRWLDRWSTIAESPATAALPTDATDYPHRP